MSDFQSKVDAIVAQARKEVLDLTQQYVASGIVGSSATKVEASATVRRTAPARKVAKKSPAPAKKQSKPATKSPRATGAKRDPAVIEKIKSDFLAHVKANPGQGIEEIKKALKLETKELTLPVKQLLADKKITTKGEKRATKYFARGE